MAKTAVPERGARSRAVRDFLKKQPKASVSDIQTALKEQGIEASSALIAKLKYTSGKGRKKKLQSTAAKRTSQNGTERGSKSQAIREAFSELGHEAPSSQIKASLEEKGISVSASMISMMRKTRPSGNGAKQRKPTSSEGVSTSNLLAAKKLIEQTGSVEAAQAAIHAFGELVEGWVSAS